MLLFDHGERRSGVPAELERLSVDVRGARLPAGDYVLSDRLVVERKGPADLAASIKDRRLFEQLGRLAEAYPSVVLIVEGDLVHMHEAPWQGALGRALTLGASVLQTRDPRDTAEWVARLYRLDGKPASAPRGSPRLRRPTDDDLQTAEDVLRSLPGIPRWVPAGCSRASAHWSASLLLDARSCLRYAASGRCAHGRWTGSSGQPRRGRPTGTSTRSRLDGLHGSWPPAAE
jgi:ERCC4-type nuclease